MLCSFSVYFVFNRQITKGREGDYHPPCDFSTPFFSFQRLPLCFLGQAIQWNQQECCTTKPEVKIQDGGLQTESTHISACRHDRNTISKAKSMFLRSSYPIEQSRTLHVLTGSGKSKMAASKLDEPISQTVDMIGTHFQRLYLCF